jgi:hypothetical protein
MVTASLAWADCISTCEANCLTGGDPTAIGLCIDSCPSRCPACEPATGLKTGVNGCSDTALVVTPTLNTATWTIRNDRTGGSATAWMTLQCKNFGVPKNAYRGPLTIIAGAISQTKNCPVGYVVASSSCGRNDSCLR